MIIAHASIPSDNPENAAKILSEIMGGQALRFPPGGPEAWMAWSGDEKIELEIVKRGRTLVYDDGDVDWRPGPAAPTPNSECHLAICVDRPAAEIIAIAQAAGWPARACVRGDNAFALSEVWVDGAFMIEFLDPAQTAHYLEVVTPTNWKRYKDHMGAA